MEILTLETLPQFDDGAVAVAFNRALTNAFRDCYDRPTVSKPREITLKLVIKPEVDANLERATVEAVIGEKIPPKSTARSVRAVTKRNGFGFETDTRSVDFDPDQRAFNREDD